MIFIAITLFYTNTKHFSGITDDAKDGNEFKNDNKANKEEHSLIKNLSKFENKSERIRLWIKVNYKISFIQLNKASSFTFTNYGKIQGIYFCVKSIWF